MAEEFENTSQDTQADVKGAGTMLAAPFEIAKQDTLLEVQQTVNETKTTIGNIDDPAGEESLVGLIKNIPETVPTGAVKSVQRGNIILAQGNKTVDVQISKIDPGKSLILLTSGILTAPGNVSSNDSSAGNGVVIDSISENKFTVSYYCSSPDIGANVKKISWQVIEFY